MTVLILVVLSNVDEVVITEVALSLHVDLELTSAAADAGVGDHVLVESSQGVLIRPRSNVEQDRVLGVQVLGDSVEVPVVRVNLALVLLLDSEHEVDLPVIRVRKVKITGVDLEKMEEVTGIAVDLAHVLHSLVAALILRHKALVH